MSLFKESSAGGLAFSPHGRPLWGRDSKNGHGSGNCRTAVRRMAAKRTTHSACVRSLPSAVHEQQRHARGCAADVDTGSLWWANTEIHQSYLDRLQHVRTHTHTCTHGGRPHLIMQSVSCGGPSSGAGRPHACYEYEWNYVWAVPHDMSHSSTSWNYAQHGQRPALQTRTAAASAVPLLSPCLIKARC